MQLKKYFALFFCLGFLFYSCQDDVIENTDTTITLFPPTVNVASGINGIVTDQNGQALENVTIDFSGKDYTTDANGYFKVIDEKTTEGGEVLKFSYPGYFDNFKFHIPDAGKTGFLRVEMIDRTETGQVNTTTGGTIEIEGGSKVSFPANAFQTQSGAPYNGEVSVFAHWYDPTANNLNASMPGDLRALNADQELVQLATFGMIAVELEASNGTRVELRDNIEATLEFPVPESIQGDAPDEIEIWSLDEDSGIWIEENTAQLENGIYVAQVTHFSFWNCDAPFPVVPIYGKLVDSDGNPLSYYSICIQVFNDTRTGYGWTDSDGGFRGKVPKGERLIFQVKDDCGNVVLEQIIGPFSSETSLGEIVVDHPEQVTITGILLDCDGNPVTNGYARIDLEESPYYYIAETNEQGEFSITTNKCRPLDGFTVQGFDLTNFTQSELLIFEEVEEIEINLGNIIVCDNIDEFIQVKLESGDIFINLDVDASILDGHLVIETDFDSTGSFRLNARINNIALGDNDDVDFFNFLIENSNTFAWASCGETAGQQEPCVDFNFTITNLGLAGDYVEGEFMGTLLFQSDNTTQVIMGSFRIIIDQIVETGSISGLVWFGEDRNGIRDNGEDLTPISRISVVGENGNIIQTLLNVSEYSFDGLPPGTYRILASNTSIGQDFTLQDQGGDDTLDSDVNPVNGYSNDIVLGFDEDITGVDVGLVTSLNLECDVEVLSPDLCNNGSGEANLYVFGGSSPYNLSLITPDGSTEDFQFSDEVYPLIDLLPGQYTFVVFDQAGAACDGQFGIWSDSLWCELEVINPTCGVNDGYLEVFTNLQTGAGNLNYLWNT